MPLVSIVGGLIGLYILLTAAIYVGLYNEYNFKLKEALLSAALLFTTAGAILGTTISIIWGVTHWGS